MLKTGIIGYPLTNSLSPRMHNCAFEKYSINGTYIPIPVLQTKLKEALRCLNTFGFKGVNVTSPFKVRIMEFLDDWTEEVNTIGAVNTVLIKNGNLIGYNTDAYGFEKSLKEHGVNTDNKVILLIGAGGSAKACVYVLNNRNVKRLFIANRTKQKAVTLSKTFGGEVIMFKKIKSLAKDVDIIINCTSIDLKNEVLPYMKKQSIYYDVNYRFGIVTKRSVKMITGNDT